MAFTPDQPFPKTPGNPIMSKDWNDAIGEVQRLDQAKVNRAGADTMAGPLTINNALAVGTTLAAQAGTQLHVVDTATPAIARVQTTAVNGSARLELWSDPRNSGTEWRPGYIESFDLGGFTGGLKFVTNGTGPANRQGASEQLRLVNGAAGFGVTDPSFRIETLGRIRIRQNTPAGETAGLWLHAATPNNSRALVGLANDNTVGFWGNQGAGWGLQMDVTNGNATHLTTSNPAVLRVQSQSAFGAARVELWSDPPGSATEWRPAYIESFDMGSFTGGLRIVTNGTGQANRQASAEQVRIVNGAMGIGVTDPGFTIDVGGRARFRGGNNGPAGFWFYSPAAAVPKDRAFIGLVNDNTIGLWGSTGANWGFQMDTTTGNVTISPGRVYDNKYRNEVWASGSVSNAAPLPYRLIPGMSATFTLPLGRTIWVWLHLPGCQMTGDSAHSAAYFNMTLDGGEIAFTRQEWHNNGWELRDVTLTRMFFLGAGTHTIACNWAVGAGGGTITGCYYNDARKLMIVEL